MIILHNTEMKSTSEVKYFFIDRSNKLKDQKIFIIPMIKTPWCHCRGHRFACLSGNQDATRKEKCSNGALHFKVYLFTFGCAGSLLGHWLFFFFLTGFSVVVARWGYSLVVERGLSGTWASVVVAPGL